MFTKFPGASALGLAAGFVRLLTPSTVAASLLVLCEYHGWRLAGTEGMCAECGYNLTGNVSGRCPECGEAAPRKAES
jgi:predicted Zn-ribbon and HTH transcriptional regulator